MYIEKELYLSLYQKWEQSQKQNDILIQQNTILANQVEKEKVINIELKEKMNEMQERFDTLNSQMVRDLKLDLKEYMKIHNDQQKELVECKFNQLEQSSVKKYQALEIKYKEHMHETYQQFKFCNSLMGYYRHDVVSFQQKKTAPSYKDLKKWVRELVRIKNEFIGIQNNLIQQSQLSIKPEGDQQGPLHEKTNWPQKQQEPPKNFEKKQQVEPKKKPPAHKTGSGKDIRRHQQNTQNGR